MQHSRGKMKLFFISSIGHGPRLSKVNLFTLLSLWLELFPQEEPEEDDQNQVSVHIINEIHQISELQYQHVALC